MGDPRNISILSRFLLASSGTSLHYLPPFYLPPASSPRSSLLPFTFHLRRHELGFVQTPRRAQRLHQQTPDAASIIAGDFNKANLRKVMPNFHQHVSCPTRGPNTLDHCYTQFKNAYKARSLPAFGKSDHAAIFLTHRNINKGSFRNPRGWGKWRAGPPTLKLCYRRLLMTSTGTCSGRVQLTSASSRT